MVTKTMTPADATHVGPGGQAYKYAGASCWIWTGNLWSLIRDLPAQAVEIKREWDGEGLPPIGTVCEVRFPNDSIPKWEAVTVIYVGRIFGAVKFEDGEVSEFSVKRNEAEFRPFRTADQIAAYEREAAILALSTDAGSPIPNASQRAVAERLIDAGWIKRS